MKLKKRSKEWIEGFKAGEEGKEEAVIAEYQRMKHSEEEVMRTSQATGQEEGLRVGRAEGVCAGEKSGYMKGYNAGVKAGRKQGYQWGYQDGQWGDYNEGKGLIKPRNKKGGK
jgi:hypothetical protein